MSTPRLGDGGTGDAAPRAAAVRTPRPPSARLSWPELWVAVVQTLLRMVPFPTRTGLRRIGSPGRHSPVLLTANFGLTVQRVRRAMAGLDAWLLVANSRGVNVWCAAVGGRMTDHDVVSVIKTSGIDGMVDHRGVILPQLAATGIDGRAVRHRSGCAQVCPKNVLEIDHARHLAVLARPDGCIQCGACVVQCPFDALSFRAPDGAVVPPQVVREFKLNLLGTRTQRRA